MTPRGVDPSHGAAYPTPPGVTGDLGRPEMPRVSEDAEEYYATSKAPSQAPPPPPRPDKVRPGQQDAGLGSNNPYVPAEPRVSSPTGWPNDYVQSAARRQQRNAGVPRG
jgi:hypothetical protein